MKLIFAIVHNDDSRKVTDELNSNGFSVTKLCSTGGFLKSGNTTLLVGVDEDRVNSVIEIIQKKSKSRKQAASGKQSNFAVPSGAVEVVVGGATVFVTDVERFEKV